MLRRYIKLLKSFEERTCACIELKLELDSDGHVSLLVYDSDRVTVAIKTRRIERIDFFLKNATLAINKDGEYYYLLDNQITNLG